MSVSPEFEIQTAYSQGRAAVFTGFLGANPYSPTTQAAQNAAWIMGFQDGCEDYNNSVAGAGGGPDLLTAGLPRVQKRGIVFAEADVRTLFSAPATILSGVTGITRVPVFMHIFREAGSAYGAASGQFQIVSSSGLSTYFGTGLVTNMIQQTLKGVVLLTQYTGGSGDLGLFSETGQSVQARFNGANPTGGTGRLLCTLFWRDYSMDPL